MTILAHPSSPGRTAAVASRIGTTRYAGRLGVVFAVVFVLAGARELGAASETGSRCIPDCPAAASVLAALPPAPPARVAALPDIPASTRHDIHLTYSRVLIDGGSMLWRVRLFRDDLEKALRARARNLALTAATPGADTAFAAYFNEQVPVTVNGVRLTGTVLESGADPDATDEAMWWYVLEFTASPPVRTLTVRVGLLFDYFSDQRNIVTVLKAPGNDRRSMYFVRDDAKGQTITF